MSGPLLEITRVRRVALVLFGLALCALAWPFLQPLPARKPSADELLYPVETYALDDPHSSLSYQFFQDRIESIGVAAIRRSVEHRVGKECVITCIYRCSPSS